MASPLIAEIIRSNAKWEAGDIPFEAKLSKERTERLFNLVTNYQNRDTIPYLKGIAHNFTF